jgi:hypothetical protein
MASMPVIKRNPLLLLKILLIATFAYFFILMAEITWRYVPFDRFASFLAIKQTEVDERSEYLWFFYAHVYTSLWVLLAGFLAILRLKYWPKLHQYMGKIYVGLIVFVAAPSGLYMGIFANGEWIAQVSFILLSVLWWWITVKAYRLARQQQYGEHTKWMWRSFALTLSAITLRLWKVILVYLLMPNPMDLYQVIAWLGWVPNLLLIEVLIAKKIL